MVVRVIKNPGETNEHLIQRFKKAFRDSRMAQAVKAGRYFQRTVTKRIQRQRALKREFYRGERAKKMLVS